MTKEKLEEFLIKFYKLQDEYNLQLYAKEKDNLVLYSLIGEEVNISEIVCWFNHNEINYTNNEDNQIRLEVNYK